MRKGRRRRIPMAAMDQINVTPLLDLTFLLLIAFMITMPPLLLEYGIDVNAPELNSSDLPEGTSVNLTVAKNREYRIDNQIVSRQELQSRLQALHNSNPKAELLVRGDGEVSYNEVVQLLGIARDAGFKDATLVTRPEE